MGQGKQKVAIVVPVYKASLSETDKIALSQLQRVLGAYPKIFLAPASLSFDYGKLGKGFSVERFPDEFFQNPQMYSILLLRKAFYERFLGYEYILIYQTDAFVFSDRLQEFCAMGYDYIGAPIGRYAPTWHAVGARVGNGGISLRRVSACLRMLDRHEDWLYEDLPMQEAFFACEDAFFGACGRWDATFRVPDVSTALAFAVQDCLQHAAKRMKEGWRPFGCHAWLAGAEKDVWKFVIEAEGYDLSGVKFPNKYPFWLYYLKLNWRTHRELPLHRMYGCILHGNPAGALSLMARALMQYEESAEVWRNRVTEFTYLWRMAGTFVQDATLRGLLENAFEEGICRSFLAGRFEPNDVGLAEELMRFHLQDKRGHERFYETVQAARRAQDESTAPEAVQPAHHDGGRKIVAISMVKNEMDGIESFVRHTPDVADQVLIADHKSTDRTREILENLQKEGLPIIIEDVADARYEQAEVMTHLLQEAAETYAADLILPLDADEFLVPTGKTSVRTLLEQLSAEEVHAIPWRKYVQQHAAVTSPNTFLLSVPLYRAADNDKGQKVIVGGELVRREHVPLVQGNHGIIRTNKEAHEQSIVFGNLAKGMEIAHFFWRNPAQIRSKYAVGWPNIVAKYTVNTTSGGSYREAFGRVLRGEAPDMNEGVRQWKQCDLRGSVPLPELRYSKETEPDVLANVMASSEALAEELAETRALSEQPLVTTIVPYLGDDTAFNTSLASACAEVYPWRELLVPVMAGDLTATLASEVTGQGVRILDEPSALLSSVHGKYVEWLLPGETVKPEKLRRMVSCMELQTLPYPLLLSDAGQAYSELSPYIDVGVEAEMNLQQADCGAFWHGLLASGKFPSRGLSGLLMRREVFEACHGLLDGFADGRPHFLSLWRTLLRTSGEQPCRIISVMRDDYTGAAPEPSLMDIAAHQLDWHALCVEDGAQLDAATKAKILDRQRRIGIYLLEHALAEGRDLQSGIWPAYQQMLVTL